MNQPDPISEAILEEPRQAEDPVSESAPTQRPSHSYDIRARHKIALAIQEGASALMCASGSADCITAFQRFIEHAKEANELGRLAGWRP
jgi:hypothetical protein